MPLLRRAATPEEAALLSRRREPRPARIRLLRFLPVLVILGLLVHVLLPRLASVETSIATIRTLEPWAIAVALLSEILSYVSNGALLQAIVKLGDDRLRLARAAAIELGAGSVALVAAGSLGFGAAIYRWCRGSGVSRESAMLASWLPSLFDALALALFALAGALELVVRHELSPATELALGIVMGALALVVGAVVVLLVRDDWMNALAVRGTRWIKRIRPAADESVLTDIADHAAEAWKTIRSGAWLRPTCYSLLFLTFDLLCLRFVFIAARQRLPIALVIAGYGVPVLLGRVSFLPGGIAVVEVAMAALYSGLGVPAGAAVVVVLTYRLISFWLPAVSGIPIAVTFESHRRRARRRGD